MDVYFKSIKFFESVGSDADGSCSNDSCYWDIFDPLEGILVGIPTTKNRKYRGLRAILMNHITFMDQL